MFKKSPASSPAAHSTMNALPQKDYAAAYGMLQARYGFGGLPTPPLPQVDGERRKWYKWGASRTSSTASLITPAMRSSND